MSTPHKWYKKKSVRVVGNCGRQMIQNAYVRLRYLHPERRVEEMMCAVVNDLVEVGVGLVMDVKKEEKEK